ncbi:MAG: hypothetical protein QOC56_2898 [Alphaproteobacteria bacterium]|jgi:hypothetical protein|nr:hypothetical protein [Alphaproteobacteria bacterium]
MIKTNFALLITSLFAASLHVAPAQAQTVRTFVSANGSDANTCARPQPCRTLQGAHNKTNAGGEINMLDPAGYGIVTINKSISIVNDGVGSAGVLVGASQTGITINAGPNDVINLRGLIIEGAGAGQDGIVFSSGKSLTMQNMVVRGLTGQGIRLVPTTSSNFAVSNTLVADNADSGITVRPVGTSLTVKAVFNSVEVSNNFNIGIGVDGTVSTGTINVSVLESVAANNPGIGFGVQSSLGQAVTTMTLVRSAAVNNGGPVAAGAQGDNATIRIGQTTITGNANGWGAVFGATLQSYNDNYVDGNAASQGTQTTIPTK